MMHFVKNQPLGGKLRMVQRLIYTVKKHKEITEKPQNHNNFSGRFQAFPPHHTVCSYFSTSIRCSVSLRISNFQQFGLQRARCISGQSWLDFPNVIVCPTFPRASLFVVFTCTIVQDYNEQCFNFASICKFRSIATSFILVCPFSFKSVFLSDDANLGIFPAMP